MGWSSGEHYAVNLLRRSWISWQHPSGCTAINARPFPTRADRTTTLCGTQSAKLGRTRFRRVGRSARYRIERLDTRTDETSSLFSARYRVIDGTSVQRVHMSISVHVVYTRCLIFSFLSLAYTFYLNSF